MRSIRDRRARPKLRLVRQPSIEASAEEIAQARLDLELAHERLRFRRAFIAKLVVDIRTDATVGAVLRKALIDREQAEHDCRQLEDKVSLMRSDEK